MTSVLAEGELRGYAYAGRICTSPPRRAQSC